MLSLAIDASSKVTTVAVVRDGVALADLDLEYFSRQAAAAGVASTAEVSTDAAVAVVPPKFRPGTSALLTPLIQTAVEVASVAMADLDLVAFSIGPGLFTGLRVGVVTAKGLAFALGVPVIGVNTLEVIAAQTAQAHPGHAGPIEVAINAQRQQLFTGRYRATSQWSVESLGDSSPGDTQLKDRPAWLAELAGDSLVAGAGIRLFREEVEQYVEQAVAQNTSVTLTDEAVWDCCATSVAHVAAAHFERGRRDDHWTLEPFYFRPSAAEEVLLAKAAAPDVSKE